MFYFPNQFLDLPLCENYSSLPFPRISLKYVNLKSQILKFCNKKILYQIPKFLDYGLKLLHYRRCELFKILI